MRGRLPEQQPLSSALSSLEERRRCCVSMRLPKGVRLCTIRQLSVEPACSHHIRCRWWLLPCNRIQSLLQLDQWFTHHRTTPPTLCSLAVWVGGAGRSDCSFSIYNNQCCSDSIVSTSPCTCATVQTCGGPGPAESFDWESPSGWSACSVTCGSGTRVRSFVCYSSTGKTVDTRLVACSFRCCDLAC